jgi:transcriptional regulator with XRE-family HTH domain
LDSETLILPTKDKESIFLCINLIAEEGEGMGKESLGAYVATRRKALNFTQNDLARALGYSNQAISKFESEGSLLSIMVLPELANFLHLSFSDLVNRNPNPVPPSKPAEKFNPEAFRQNLISLRQKSGYSQSQEARLLGVSARSIQNYESGSSYPSFASLEKLVETFQVSIDDLFYPIAMVAPAEIAPKPASAPEPTSAPKTINPHKKPFFFSRVPLMGALLAGSLIVACTVPAWGIGSVNAQNKLAGASSEGTSSNAGGSSSSSGSASNNPGASFSSFFSSVSSSSNSSSSTGASSSSSSSSDSGTSSSSGSSSSQGGASSSPTSSSDSGASSSSSSSSSQGGNSSSSSSSSSTPSDWLSPYLPGLTSFVLSDEFNVTDSSTLYNAENLFYLVTKGMDFTPANSSKYALEYSFENAPAGVQLTSYDNSAIYYTYRKVVVDPSVPKEVSFTLRAKAYAIAHPEAPIYSNALTLTTNDYSLADYDSNYFPGLKRVDVLVDGVSSLAPVGLGTHQFSLSTYPANYLRDHSTTTVKLSSSWEGNCNVTTSGDTFTVADHVPLNDLINDSVNVIFTNSVAGNWHFFNVIRPLIFDGGHTEVSALGRPNFLLLDGNHVGGDYAAGTYTLKTQAFSWVTPAFNDTDYLFKVAFDSGSLPPDGLSVSYGGFNDPITLTVPAGLRKDTPYILNGYLIKRSDAKEVITSANFSVFGI